jgi:hypothetical protein
MNPVPWFLRGMTRWEAIKREVEAWAEREKQPSYGRNPHLYRFHGWGIKDMRVACNVTFYPPDLNADPIDIEHRFTGQYYESGSIPFAYNAREVSPEA